MAGHSRDQIKKPWSRLGFRAVISAVGRKVPSSLQLANAKNGNRDADGVSHAKRDLQLEIHPDTPRKQRSSLPYVVLFAQSMELALWRRFASRAGACREPPDAPYSSVSSTSRPPTKTITTPLKFANRRRAPPPRRSAPRVQPTSCRSGPTSAYGNFLRRSTYGSRPHSTRVERLPRKKVG